jgi:hypothetical protein
MPADRPQPVRSIKTAVEATGDKRTQFIRIIDWLPGSPKTPPAIARIDTDGYGKGI